MKPPRISWTVELKFYSIDTTTSKNDQNEYTDEILTSIFADGNRQIAHVTLHNVLETIQVQNLISSDTLVKMRPGDDEKFGLWVTEAKNKENGGVYDWSQLKLAIKQMVKVQKVERHIDEEVK